MWIMTPRGFFSVVQHRDDPLDVRVRARSRDDLERLCDLPTMERFRATIEEDQRADYRWRIPRMSKANWRTALDQLGDEIDYENFKDAVKAVNPERAHTYLGVWTKLHAIGREGEPPPWDDDWSNPQGSGWLGD